MRTLLWQLLARTEEEPEEEESEELAVQMPMAAAMVVQANARRLLVRSRKARLIQRREVARRRRARQAKLSGDVFEWKVKEDVLRDVHMHTDEALETTASQMPPMKKPLSLGQQWS